MSGIYVEENGASLTAKDTVCVSCDRSDGIRVVCLSLGKPSAVTPASFIELIKQSKPQQLYVLTELALTLPITDTVVFFFHDGDVVVIRGASANFNLYREISVGKIKLFTFLPSPAEAILSKRGLWHYIASGIQQGCYEPNLTLHTPFRDWFRIRRGAISILGSDGQLKSETPIINPGLNKHSDDLPLIIKNALCDFSRVNMHNHHVLVEVSGGFDSTLAALAAKPFANGWSGVSIDYPYYEFRFEKAAQLASATSLSIDNHYWLDGTQFGSYTRSNWSPRTNEPCLGFTGIERTRLVAELANKVGADRILVGTGGDQLFGTDLSVSEPLYYALSKHFVNRKGLSMFKAAQKSLQGATIWQNRTAGTYIDPAALYESVYRDFGVLFVSPFADTSMLRVALIVNAIKKARSVYSSDKSILTQLPGMKLPAEISDRAGKAPYDGIWSRSYAQNGEHIAELFQDSATLFKQLGINTRWLFHQLHALMEWRSDQHQEVVIAYALSRWLNDWGVNGDADVRLSD